MSQPTSSADLSDTPRAPALPQFSPPYDWSAIDAAIADIGGVVLQGFVTPKALNRLNQQVDNYLHSQYDPAPATGSSQYDKFLGLNTIRLHGVIEKAPDSAALIGHPALLDWASRTVCATSVLLNAAEIIQINPGEPAQFLHRDSDSWPATFPEQPVIVNAIIAMDEFTVANGATAIAPHSWRLAPDALPDAVTHAVMQAGDMVLFRGDTIHGGGANVSDQPRRAFSISFCAGWLRPVENSYLNLSPATVKTLPAALQAVLGYAAYDGSSQNTGMVGLYENGDPQKFLAERD
ncbi:MAG: phytanoyl-CoA dioxygenase family protein [Pseudomonadota bacterium]